MDATGLSVYRFGRFSALSFSLMLPLLGAAAGGAETPPWRLAGLCAVALAFHLFAYISNDVADLALDRTEPLRADSPLVRGMVSPSTALTIALVQVPAAFTVLAWSGSGAPAAAALATAFAAMAVYNGFGKRIRFPPLSDAVQALGWAALAICGALAVGTPLGEATAWLAALVFVYVLLVNGVHGGLRDLENDHACGVRTTAIYLGAHADGAGGLIVPRAMVVYAFALQLVAAFISLALVQDAATARYDTRTWTVGAILATHALLVTMLWATLAATRRRSAMIRAGILHLFVSLASLVLPFVGRATMPLLAMVIFAFLIPVAVMCLHDGIDWECP